MAWTLPGFDGNPLAHPVIRVADDPLAGLDTGDDLGGEASALANLYDAFDGLAAFHNEGSPAVAMPFWPARSSSRA